MTNGRGGGQENILCAVFALLKELNENELDYVKRDVEKKLMGLRG